MMNVDAFLADMDVLKTKYRELQALTRRQASVIATGDLTPLQQLVDRKQTMMEEVQKINARTKQWSQNAEALAPEDREKANRGLKEVQQELQALLAAEEESQKVLESRRDTTSDQIQKISKGKKARNLYGGGSAGGRFIDQGG